MRKIEIEVIPHAEQRTEGAGDYYYKDNGDQVIKVSSLRGDIDERYQKLFENLIMIHELVEITMTEFHGVTEEDIQAHDEMFGKEQEAGLHSPEAEPGDDPRSPYRIEHQTSETVERMILSALGLSFTEYDEYFFKTLYTEK
jgi:hypothetical protein